MSSNSIILRGMGENQMLVTSGYGLSVEIKPTESKIVFVNRLLSEALTFEQWKRIYGDVLP